METKQAIRQREYAEKLLREEKAEQEASARAQEYGRRDGQALLKKLQQTAQAMVQVKCQVFKSTKRSAGRDRVNSVSKMHVQAFVTPVSKQSGAEVAALAAKRRRRG